jgi:large subunit ribosomal protein L22
MKTQKVQLNYLNVTPRKTRLIANTLKNLPILEAEAQLTLRPNRVAGPLLKLLRSAVASAKTNTELDLKKLIVAEVIVNPGPVLKRSLPRAQGRATPLLKRTSHVTLILKEVEKNQKERFIFIKEEKKKKNKATKEKKDTVVKDEGAIKEEEKESKKRAEKVRPTDTSKDRRAKEPGVFKKIFNRKSI